MTASKVASDIEGYLACRISNGRISPRPRERSYSQWRATAPIEAWRLAMADLAAPVRCFWEYVLRAADLAIARPSLNCIRSRHSLRMPMIPIDADFQDGGRVSRSGIRRTG